MDNDTRLDVMYAREIFKARYPGDLSSRAAGLCLLPICSTNPIPRIPNDLGLFFQVFFKMGAGIFSILSTFSSCDANEPNLHPE